MSMSKYEPLWKWIAENGTDSFKLTFDEIESIAGIPIDHSFLRYKKELWHARAAEGAAGPHHAAVLHGHAEGGRSL